MFHDIPFSNNYDGVLIRRHAFSVKGNHGGCVNSKGPSYDNWYVIDECRYIRSITI